MERGKQQEKWAAPLRGSASSTELRSPLTPPGGGAIGAAGMRVPLMPKSTPAICLLQWSACAGAAIVRLLLCGTQPASLASYFYSLPPCGPWPLSGISRLCIFCSPCLEHPPQPLSYPANSYLSCKSQQYTTLSQDPLPHQSWGQGREYFPTKAIAP